MAAFLFVITGLGVAIGAGVVGMIVVSLIEIFLAYRDPRRAPIIRSRTWRQNLHHMLH
jgi:hypothetical protein